MNLKIIPGLGLSIILSLLCAARAQAGDDASLTDTPKFSELAMPEPPSQHKHWSPPRTDLPTNLISSVKILFDLGLADPRGCEYREFAAATGSVRSQTNEMGAHGWILPARSGSKQAFAVSWDGLVYPALVVGKKANLKQDMEALLRADEIWRKKQATNQFAFRGWWFWNSPDGVMSQSNMTVIKVALLLRLIRFPELFNRRRGEPGGKAPRSRR